MSLESDSGEEEVVQGVTKGQGRASKPRPCFPGDVRSCTHTHTLTHTCTHAHTHTHTQAIALASSLESEEPAASLKLTELKKLHSKQKM